MKRLKFRSSNIPLILDGSKTATWRMKDDKDLAAGDEVTFVNASTGQDFATASLTSVTLSSIRDLSEADKVGNVDFASNNELLDHMQQTYGTDVTTDTPMKVVRFKVLGRLHDRT